jgi:hypothetical protein
MGKLILGLIAAFVVILLLLAVVHVILFYAFFIALIVLVAFTVFKMGRWSGRRNSRDRQRF